MKQLGAVLTILAVAVFLYGVGCRIYGDYQYEKNIASSWKLADKASTIEQKSKYVDKFVTALEESGLEGLHDAVFLTTPDNSFDKNLEALKSLQARLHEIKTMDVTSFEYQTAIQQITAQEQGEALRMLAVFEQVWWKENYFFLWSWIAGLSFVGVLVMFILGLFLWID